MYYDIPGFPRYKINVKKCEIDGEFIHVISYCKDPQGRILLPTKWNCDIDSVGWKLYGDEGVKSFSVAELRTIVEREKLKRIREEMNYMSKHTSIVKNNPVSTGYWIVGSIHKGNGQLSVAPNPAQHLTEETAKAEAARLAQIHKEKKFVALKICAIASAQDVTWE